jgi:hypothetical protein
MDIGSVEERGLPAVASGEGGFAAHGLGVRDQGSGVFGFGVRSLFLSEANKIAAAS